MPRIETSMATASERRVPDASRARTDAASAESTVIPRSDNVPATTATTAARQ